MTNNLKFTIKHMVQRASQPKILKICVLYYKSILQKFAKHNAEIIIKNQWNKNFKIYILEDKIKIFKYIVSTFLLKGLSALSASKLIKLDYVHVLFCHTKRIFSNSALNFWMKNVDFLNYLQRTKENRKTRKININPKLPQLSMEQPSIIACKCI